MNFTVEKHFKYVSYIMRHKWYVGKECLKHGLPIRALTHDMSKFLPSEWFPYVEFFHGKKAKPKRDKSGYYKPTDTGDLNFDWAWLLHQKRNRHHWQFYVLPEDEGGLKILPMDKKDRLEMACDWCGASIAQGKDGWVGENNVLAWYNANKNKMQLHKQTRVWVEYFIKRKAEGR